MQCACGMEIKMTKIILASNNKGKIKEVKEICKDMQVEIVSMKEAGIDIDIEENGTTFARTRLSRTIRRSNLLSEVEILLFSSTFNDVKADA